jgi:hypothetical protein
MRTIRDFGSYCTPNGKVRIDAKSLYAKHEMTSRKQENEYIW